MHAVAAQLRDLGHEVIEQELQYSPALITGVVSRYLRGIADSGRALPHPERLSRRARGYLRIGGAIPQSVVERAKASAAADGEQLNRPSRGIDLVLTPMFTRRPPPVGKYEGRPAAIVAEQLDPASSRTARRYNHTGQPAASVPAGLHRRRLPARRRSSSRRARARPRCSRSPRSSRRARGWAAPAGRAL